MTGDQKTLEQEMREMAVAEAAVLAGGTLTRGQKRLLGIEQLVDAELENELERIRTELRAHAQSSENRVDASTVLLGQLIQAQGVGTAVETPHRPPPVQAEIRRFACWCCVYRKANSEFEVFDE